jgi:hypothetical protein
MIIIGSKALYSNNASLVNQERLDKSDFDVIMSTKDFSNWYSQFKDVIIELVPRSSNKYVAKILINNVKKMYEIELEEKGTSSAFLLNNLSNVCNNIYVDPLGIKWNSLKLEYLYLTKKSHLHFPVHFEKNINDYHIIKNKLGDFKQTGLMERYFTLRNNEAKKRFSEKHNTPRLNVTNFDFFKISGVEDGRVYIHDDLHEVIKHFDRPVYEMMKKDENFDMAWCEKDMFKKLPFEYRIKCVQEEAYVIALERYIIPEKRNYEDFFWCYKRALMRICTTLCSGFFRDFACDNYLKIVDSYDDVFVDKFNYAVKNDFLKPMKKVA